MKKYYKDTLLNQTCVVILNGIKYWLIYENNMDDYNFIKWDANKNKTVRLQQQKSPAIARISDFDTNLNHKDFGQIEEILVFRTGYEAFYHLQRKSKSQFETIKVDSPKIITMDDIRAKFGDHIVLKI